MTKWNLNYFILTASAGLYLPVFTIYDFTIYYLRPSDLSIWSNFFLKGHSRIQNITMFFALETVIPPLYVASIIYVCVCVCVFFPGHAD